MRRSGREARRAKGEKGKERGAGGKETLNAPKQLRVTQRNPLGRVDDAGDNVRDDDGHGDELEEFLGAPHALEVATGEGEGEEGEEELREVELRGGKRGEGGMEGGWLVKRWKQMNATKGRRTLAVRPT